MVNLAERILSIVARIATALSMIGLALLVILFTSSIVGRMFGLHIPAVDDIGSIMLAAVFAYGLAAAVGSNEHLSITLLVDALPEKVRWWLLRATEAISIAVASYLFIGVYHLFSAALRSNQKMLGALPIPRYLPMSFVLTGIGLFVIALACVFIRNILSRQPAAAPEH
ncbi:MAG: TRAP transporter small permease [Mesorhizobium sp.]